MGAGGGLPGLVVAQQWPEASLVLLEANERRSAFLRRVVDRLELADRVSILQERAEICGRDPEWRATFDGAIARSFGRPAVLAECTAPLLKPGAWIVVSEPPTSTQVPTAQPASASVPEHQPILVLASQGQPCPDQPNAASAEPEPLPRTPGRTRPGRTWTRCDRAWPGPPHGTCWRQRRPSAGRRQPFGSSASSLGSCSTQSSTTSFCVRSRSVRSASLAAMACRQEAVVLIRRAEARLGEPA